MKITLGNTRCLVEGSFEEQAWLQLLLTTETDERDFHGVPKTHSFFRTGQGSFPSGLIHQVLHSDPPDGVTVEFADERTKIATPEVRTVPGFDYYDFQKEAIREILSNKQGLIQVATNGGKTVIMAGLLRTLVETGLRGVVLTHRREIFDQLVETFNSCLGQNVGKVLSDDLDVCGRQFVVAMAQTLVNRVGDDPEITELWEGHQVLLADEAHHLQAETWRRLFSSSSARIKIGFSGTIPDEGTHVGWLVRAYTGPVLIDVRNRELIDAGISAKPTVEMHAMDSSHLFEGLYKECLSEFAREHGNLFKGGGRWRNPHLKMRFFGFYQRRCIEVGVIRCENRNARITSVVACAREDGKQSLIIVDRLAHGEILLDLFMNTLKVPAAFIHGDAPARREVLECFKRGELRVLISSQILDEGVDISGIDVLVLAGGMKCKREILQRIGRGLRRKRDRPNVLTIIDFMDGGNRYLENYTQERLKIYKAEGFEVTPVLED